MSALESPGALRQDSLLTRLSNSIRADKPIDWQVNQSFEAIGAITKPLERFDLTPYGELDQSLCRVTQRAFDKLQEELSGGTRSSGLSCLTGYYRQLSALEKKLELNYRQSRLGQKPDYQPPSSLLRRVVKNQLAILDSNIGDAVSNFISPRKTPASALKEVVDVAGSAEATDEEKNPPCEADWECDYRLKSSDMFPGKNDDTAQTFIVQEAYQRLRKELTGPDRMNGLNCLAAYYRRLSQSYHELEADYLQTRLAPETYKERSPSFLRLVLKGQLATLNTLVGDVFYRLNPPKRRSIERLIDRVKRL